MSKGYEIIYRDKDPKTFWNLFDELKNYYKFIGSKYDQIVLDYYQIRAIDSGYLFKDYSCIFLFNGEPYSAFIGALFSKNNDVSLSLFEVPCLVIDKKIISLKQKKQISAYLKKLLELNFNSFKVKGPNYNNSFPVICDLMLSKLNANLKIVTSRIIDLTYDEDDLKKSIRKSYHSLINWGLRELKIEIFDQNNITWEVIAKFRNLHIAEAKRETRSIGTWEKQFEAIKCGNAFCITAELNNEFVSAAFFSCASNLSYYGSSASRRDLFDKPITHALIWKAILESKKRGAILFDIGSTFVGNNHQIISQKEKNIGYFKDGFGGKLTLDTFVELNS